MVLRPGNSARRADTENLPPAPAVKGAAATRLRSNRPQDSSRRRRGRANALPRDSKSQAEQAKRRNALKPKSSTTSSLKFTISKASGSRDVEMQNASPQAPQTIPIVLPKVLARPNLPEVSPEAINAVENGAMANANPQFIRDQLKEVGPDMLVGLGAVNASLSGNVLPTELEVSLNSLISPPTHMVAVFGPPPKAGPSRPRKVTLYPIHSVFLAAHCTNLPAFPPEASTSQLKDQTELPARFVVPVRSLCLPSPENYPHLAAYLYHKNTTTLLNALLPVAVPSSLEENQETQADAFATRLGRIFTFELLLARTMMVHGMWQNACALGIVDVFLWDTIDLAWEILLTALAVSSGNPSLMIESESLPSSSTKH